MQIVIGKKYKLGFAQDSKDQFTPWHADPNSKLYKYPTWGDLEGYLVIVIGKTKVITVSDYFVVSLELVSDPTFIVPGKCLNIPTRRLQRTVCICDSLDLYHYGCRCNAIIK